MEKLHLIDGKIILRKMINTTKLYLKKTLFPNYIKLDVDGIELDILYGMEEILKNVVLKKVRFQY